MPLHSSPTSEMTSPPAMVPRTRRGSRLIAIYRLPPLASPRICNMSIATIAPTIAVLAASSYGGDTSTTSPPIALTPFKHHRISRCNADVHRVPVSPYRRCKRGPWHQHQGSRSTSGCRPLPRSCRRSPCHPCANTASADALLLFPSLTTWLNTFLATP